jgi:mRNA-degrading endonuclease HigB of HigAB toxin-antitoxin module
MAMRMKNQERESIDVTFARMLCDLLGQGREAAAKHLAESSEAVVWIVGLASALLAASFAEPVEVRRVLGTNHAWTAGSLWLAIVGGASYRVLTLWVAGNFQAHVFQLEAFLTGYVGGSTAFSPAVLSRSWDEMEIVAHIQSEFGQDYRFLLTHDASLERCQQLYEEMCQRWHERDEEKHAALEARLKAYLDLDVTRGPSMTDARRRMQRLKRAARFGTVLFAMTTGAFVFAMFLIVRGLWIS